MPTSEEIARLHQQQQRGVILSLLAAILGLWRRLDRERLAESWRAGIGPSIVEMMARAQLQVAASVPVYLRELAAAQGITMPDLELVPERLSGTTSTGGPLETALYQPIVAFKKLLSDGVPQDEAMRRATAGITMIAATQAADAGRAAIQVGMTATKEWVSYVRAVNLPACSRCIVLAGRVYTYSTGFQRHPNCDCSMIPFREGDAVPSSPGDLFEQMSPDEQNRRFGKAGAESIRLGADINQVVAARRGMKSVGDQLVTTEGVTRRGVAGRRMRKGAVRLMPEQILADAGGDRDTAIRSLQQNGYLINRASSRQADSPKAMDLPQA